MANVGIKSAQPNLSRHQYHPFTAITLDLGDLQPGRCTEVNPDDNWHTIEAKGSMRLAPQIFPAYGRCSVKTAAFFVSQSQLQESSKAFHNKQSLYKGKPVHSVWFKADSLNKYFFDHSSVGPNQLCSIVHSTSTPINDQPTVAFDFCFAYDSAGTVFYRFLRLTPLGRSYFKIAKSLGYDFVSYPCAPVGGTLAWSDIAPHVQFPVDALPLIAYLKVVADYFINPHFYNSSTLVTFLNCIYNIETAYGTGLTLLYSSSTGELSDDWWDHINPLGYAAPYEHNFYLDAFNSPNSPTGVSPASELSDLSPFGLLSPLVPEVANENNIKQPQSVAIDSDNTFLRIMSENHAHTFSGLTQLGLFNLKSAFDFVNRNHLFGSKSIELFFARFGIKTRDFNNYFASKLFESSSEVDFSAVLSNTDNYDPGIDAGKTLGSYAGFGAAGLNFKFDYKADDYGFVIVLHWIQIVPIKVRGMAPAVLRHHPEDWWKPEYDGKALRCIPQCEIGVNKKSDSSLSDSNGDDQPFGYIDIYDDYREQPDVVAGDFCFDEIASRFLFARDFSYYRRASARTHVQPQLASLQYMKRLSNPDVTNPFQMSQDEGDRFYLFMSYRMDAQRQLLSKSDSLMLNGEGDQDMQLGGTQIR